MGCAPLPGEAPCHKLNVRIFTILKHSHQVRVCVRKVMRRWQHTSIGATVLIIEWKFFSYWGRRERRNEILSSSDLQCLGVLTLSVAFSAPSRSSSSSWYDPTHSKVKCWPDLARSYQCCQYALRSFLGSWVGLAKVRPSRRKSPSIYHSLFLMMSFHLTLFPPFLSSGRFWSETGFFQSNILTPLLGNKCVHGIGKVDPKHSPYIWKRS